jgi:hypothetical protein
MKRFIKPGLVFLIALPPLFLFCAIQHAAITVPFWDHVELGRLLIAWKSGPIHWAQLWGGHNHSRPLTYRAVLLLNAWLTDWDVRSEYVYLFASIYAAFVLQGYALWRSMERARGTAYLAFLLVVSILAFSPAGHNNHWWSMMLQLDLSHLFILAALIAASCSPRTWKGNLLAVACCWLATYTLTNGLIAFLAAMLVIQLSQPLPLRPNRFLAFWLVNFAVVVRLYFPGLPESPHQAPRLWDLAVFCLAYLGSPLASLAWFPYRDNFHLPRHATAFNACTGLALLAAAALLAWRQRRSLRQWPVAARLFVAFTVFAVGSALATGWGRAAFDEYGTANANASRYTLFGSYFLAGMVFFLARARQGEAEKGATAPSLTAGRVGLAALAVLGVLAALTYARSARVYHAAHQFNRMVMAAFAARGSSPLDRFIYPNRDVVGPFKAELQRLKIGPYRSDP